MNAEAFKKKIVPLRNKLFSHSLRLVENSEDAEDIVQECMLRLWQMREKLSSYNNIESFAMHVTRNLSVDKIRARKKTAEIDNVPLFDEKPDQQQGLEAKEAVAYVQLIIEQLPNLQQLIIRMKDVEGIEIGEIAAITGSSVESVRSNLSRARKKVRTEYFKLYKP